MCQMSRCDASRSHLSTFLRLLFGREPAEGTSRPAQPLCSEVPFAVVPASAKTYSRRGLGRLTKSACSGQHQHASRRRQRHGRLAGRTGGRGVHPRPPLHPKPSSAAAAGVQHWSVHGRSCGQRQQASRHRRLQPAPAGCTGSCGGHPGPQLHPKPSSAAAEGVQHRQAHVCSCYCWCQGHRGHKSEAPQQRR